MSSLDFFAEDEDAASISAPRDDDLATGTAAAEDRSQVVCLWADFLGRAGGRFPDVCGLGKNCCLVNDRYWNENESPSADRGEHLFS